MGSKLYRRVFVMPKHAQNKCYNSKKLNGTSCKKKKKKKKKKKEKKTIITYV